MQYRTLLCAPLVWQQTLASSSIRTRCLHVFGDSIALVSYSSTTLLIWYRKACSVCRETYGSLFYASSLRCCSTIGSCDCLSTAKMMCRLQYNWCTVHMLGTVPSWKELYPAAVSQCILHTAAYCILLRVCGALLSQAEVSSVLPHNPRQLCWNDLSGVFCVTKYSTGRLTNSCFTT